MIKYDQIYDVSVILGEQDITFPGDPPFRRELLMSRENGDRFELSALHMTSHAGTHLDFPSHFMDRGRSAADYPPERFIMGAWVVEAGEDFSTADLGKMALNSGEALIFRTNNSKDERSSNRVFNHEFVAMPIEFADFCVDKKIGLVGWDYISVDRGGDDGFPVHRRLLTNDVLILEGLDLTKVEPGKYTLICMPLNIQKGEGAPVRAVLLK
ncbi:MAG: cyclase family protein [Acidobacteriota bacterium]